MTSYPDGDREYLDGVVVERNGGTPDHSALQKILIVHLGGFEKPLRIGGPPGVPYPRTREPLPGAGYPRHETAFSSEQARRSGRAVPYYRDPVTG